MMTRRHALKTTLAAAAAPITHSLAAQTAPPAPPAPAAGPFQLPPLPYPVDALEPHLDARTMEIHHGKHHAAYVANLNKAAVAESAVGRQPIEALIRNLDRVPESVRTLVRNNGGGHLNHSLFWQMLAKGGGGPAPGELGQAITRDLGSFDAFREAFSKAALAQFGSGWAWLTLGADRKLHVESTPNQDCPLTAGREPLLGLDVWEHAYYLKYQNRRADYIAAFFNVIRWDFVAARYQAALRA